MKASALEKFIHLKNYETLCCEYNSNNMAEMGGDIHLTNGVY